MLTYLLERVLDVYGENITVKVISRSYNDYGDATETETTREQKCIVIYAQRADARAYPFANMDEISSVLYSKTKIDEGDKAVFDGKTWVVKAVRKIKDWYAMGLQEEI